MSLDRIDAEVKTVLICIDSSWCVVIGCSPAPVNLAATMQIRKSVHWASTIKNAEDSSSESRSAESSESARN